MSYLPPEDRKALHDAFDEALDEALDAHPHLAAAAPGDQAAGAVGAFDPAMIMAIIKTVFDLIAMLRKPKPTPAP